MKTIRHFSLQRSGSCYFEFLVERNFFVKVVGREKGKHPIAQKHLPLSKVQPEDPYIIVVRNPISWAVSFHQFSPHFLWYDKTKTFLDMMGRYAKTYNQTIGEWIDGSRGWVRHVDLVNDGEKTLTELGRLMGGWERRRKKWTDTTHHLHMTPFPNNRPLYKKRTIATDKVSFKGHAPEYIQMIDSDLLKRLGYGYLLEGKNK